MASTTGRITRSMTLACTSAVTTGAGEYAPMPPVLAPVSPSKMRLWSWLVAIGRMLSPSIMQIKEASSPAKNSSTTTREPAWPNLLPDSMSSMALKASSSLIATMTPLPAAKPSALMTIGAPLVRTNSLAGSISVNTS